MNYRGTGCETSSAKGWTEGKSAAMFFNSPDQCGSWRSPKELALPSSLARLPTERQGKASVALGAQLPFRTRSYGSGVGAAE